MQENMANICQCKIGYFDVMKECISCSEIYPNCNSCEEIEINQINCNKCENNYYLYNLTGTVKCV